MAKVSLEVIAVLRQTANHLEKSSAYEWGHMGCCNCGFLAHEITQIGQDEIHWRAMQGTGDWSEQLHDFCPTSGLPMDNLITELCAFGFDCDDLRHLERLSDPQILQRIPSRNLRYNVKCDVVLYLTTWATLLEEKLLPSISLRDLPVESFAAGTNAMPA